MVFIPTRVIAIEGQLESLRIRLLTNPDRISFSETSFKYAALSYCWGKNMPETSRTLEKSYSAHTKSISFSNLPQTLRDAITVTRQIGVSYLWIDALCIIQDSPEDWEKESSMMADIYSNAFVTISAVSAKGVTEGFKPQEVDRIRGKGFCYTKPDFPQNDDNTIYMFPEREKQIDILRTRGWTLQEQRLSRRRLSFANNGVEWDCQRYHITNIYPWGHKTETRSTSGLFNSEPNVRNLRILWANIVSDYSSRALTKEEDRLPALSGIANKMQSSLMTEYVAGIWYGYTLEGILWRTRRGFHHRPKTYIAPSWSWASIIGQVWWHAPLEDDMLRERPNILHIQSELKGIDRFGAVKGGTMKISGKIKQAWNPGGQAVEYAAAFDGSKRHRFGREIIDHKSKSCVGIVLYDVEEEGLNEGEIHCIRVAPVSQPQWIAEKIHTTAKAMRKPDSPVSCGLALIQTNGKANEYKRIGFVEQILDAWFDEIEETVITIL
jgi:hypothetical protein